MSFYRSVLAQMIICGVIALLGPGLWNANNSLGAGGALEPYLVNAGNSLVFALMGLFCILSPLAVNRVGVRTTLVLGTLGWPVYSAALYQNNRYGTEWFVILGAAICGLSAGLYWAAEGAIVLSYPPHARRGRYLALWLAFKNAGQLIGGAINLGLNARRATGGKISYVTIIVFIALQVLAFPASFALSPPEKTVRPDGTRIVVEERTSARHQLKMLWKVATTRRIGLLLPIFFASWFYWGYASTYLTLYFTVRARALASFLSAVTGSLAGVLFGFFLDSQKLSIKTRIRLGFFISCGIFTTMWIWVLIVQHGFEQQRPDYLDWTSPGFGRAFGIYIMLQTTGNVVQNYLYFLVGTVGDGTLELSRSTGLLRGVESWGQCASFGISSSKFSPYYTAVIDVTIWCVALIPAVFTIWEIEEKSEVAQGEGKAVEETIISSANDEEKKTAIPL
ncbi:hypothetical protein N3K66_005945 [Trichothecium roseum]|uniref:Uncharacterized protein n=1 Tax=Trichothecium roseum TaxID=47278 RepID=A0ACC0UZA4_9HYPO|nr:hypothetical protein N3K66_005945 [Trichothecium roseum]